MKKKNLFLAVDHLDNAGCNNGNYPSYEIVDSNGNVVGGGITCRCGRGCSNTDDVSELEFWRG